MPQLQSPSLHLRPITSADLPAIHQLHSLPETDRYNALGIPKDVEATRAVVQTWLDALDQQPIQTYTFAIFENQTAQFSGLFGLNIGKEKYRNAELWYKLLPVHWGKGYATEAVRCVLGFCFGTLDLHRVEAGCAVGNVASIRVLEKAGFVVEGRRRKILPLKSGWSDGLVFGMLETEWLPAAGTERPV